MGNLDISKAQDLRFVKSADKYVSLDFGEECPNVRLMTAWLILLPRSVVAK